jgi:hypothetical protein
MRLSNRQPTRVPERAAAGVVRQRDPYVAELATMRDVEYIDLPTGHWPQFTKPVQLGEAILAAVDRG